jgi:sugar lactone lactonase YvrE
MAHLPTLDVRVAPKRAFEGGRVVVSAGDAPFATDPLPDVRLGGVPVRLTSASSRRLAFVVPGGVEGHAAIQCGDGEPVGFVDVGRRIATGLHQVDGPVFDAAGNLYATVSGTRGQHVPVSIFKVTPEGEQQALASGIVNATSLAFDPFGDLCVTSRFDGVVYRVKTDGTLEKVASDLGVACGLAFTPDGTMYVGDRSGTLFRVNAAGKAIPFATLPPSIAAFHLAIGPDDAVYVSGPTLSSCDVIHRVDHRGEITVVAEGFGRPQGLAIDATGTLHVAEALAGASGVYRLGRDGRRELMVSGDGAIGLAFHPTRGVAVSSGDCAYLFDSWVEGAPKN